MGVIYLLTYIIGALFITVGTNRLIDDIVAAEPLEEAFVLMGGGMFLVVVAGLLHALVVRRRMGDSAVEPGSPMGAKGLAVASALWLVPLAWSWLQFEMFMNPVDVYPVLALVGASAVVYGILSRFTFKSRHRAAIATVFIALLGIPVGALSLALPTGHFRYHLTHVRTSVTDSWGGVQTHIYEADDPEFHHTTSAIGEETSELLHALANAERIDVNEEIAAGRMRLLKDGTLVRVNEDGTESPIESAADDLFDKAAAADARAAAEEKAKARAKFEAEREARRKGGRLFGFSSD